MITLNRTAIQNRFRALLITITPLLVISNALWPQKVNAERLPVFGVIADIQYGDKPDSRARDYRNSLHRLDRCVLELNQKNLDFVIQMGDIIDGQGTNTVASVRDLDCVLSVFNQLSAPKYHVLGNHCQAVENMTLLQRFGQKRFYYTFDDPMANGWRFIVLDGNDAGYGVMSEAQLAWFRMTLAQAQQAGEKVICFCHYALLKDAAKNHRMAKPEPILAALDGAPCVVAWIAGHDHNGGYAHRNGVHHLTLHGMVEARGSTAYAIIQLGADRMNVTGFGNEPSRELLLAIPALTFPKVTNGKETEYE